MYLDSRIQRYLDSDQVVPLDLLVAIEAEGYLVDEYLDSLSYHPPINLNYFKDYKQHGKY